MKYNQPALSGGEIAPGLQSRVDIPRYMMSLATCRNFIVRPSGGVDKRPGWRMNGAAKTNSSAIRCIPFVYSTETKYIVEVGVEYMRFWVPAAPYGYALLRDGDNEIVETATPYIAADLPLLHYTQSADVLTIAGLNRADGSMVPVMELRRTAADAFTLTSFKARRGPFRAMNANEALRMASTGTTGNVEITSTAAVFTANMVGTLVYFEEKELRNVKPWTPLEKNVPLGATRRRDGKVYTCVGVPNTAGLTGTPYYVCGSNGPAHEIGRDFDGPQDTRNDGVNDYKVGVEWEYRHGAFGIVEITEYVTANKVKAVVIERLADSIIGTAPAAAAGPWSFDGDGSTLEFVITGVTSSNPLDFAVTVAGAPVASNPYQPPTSGGGGTGGGGNAGPPRGSNPDNWHLP